MKAEQTTYRAYLETRTVDVNQERAVSRLATDADDSCDVIKVVLPSQIPFSLWVEKIRQFSLLWKIAPATAALPLELQLLAISELNTQSQFYFGQLLAAGLDSDFNRSVFEQVVAWMNKSRVNRYQCPFSFDQIFSLFGRDCQPKERSATREAFQFYQFHYYSGLSVVPKSGEQFAA